MKKFDYWITVENLIPPIDSYRYFAKVTYIYEYAKSRDKKVDYDFSETLGRTEDEAKEEMKKRFEGGLITKINNYGHYPI